MGTSNLIKNSKKLRIFTKLKSEIEELREKFNKKA